MNKCNPEHQSVLIRRLLAAGIRVPTGDYADWEPDLTIEVRNPARAKVFDCKADAEYVFDVRITNHSYSLLQIQEIKCSLPWENGFVVWIRESLRGWPERRVYRLPSGREFAPDAVLNHRYGEHGTLEPGESLEGVLLAWSMNRGIPADYPHGVSFPVQLAAVDQFERHHSSIIEVEVDRSAAIKISSSPRDGKGLFERDPKDICSGQAKRPQRQLPVLGGRGSTNSVRGICKEQVGACELNSSQPME